MVLGKDIVIQLETRTPRELHYHYELKLNTTLPSVQQPMIVLIRILGKSEGEYNVSYTNSFHILRNQKEDVM